MCTAYTVYIHFCTLYSFIFKAIKRSVREGTCRKWSEERRVIVSRHTGTYVERRVLVPP